MAVQRIGSRPAALVHQAAATFALDGTQPSSNAPAFDANGRLVFPEETLADGGGLFEFEQTRPVAVSRVTIEVPSGDVAGWSLYITDGTLDVLVLVATAVATSYTVSSVPLILLRGESLKLVMAGASAGISRATVVASVIDDTADIPWLGVSASGLGLVIGTDVQAWSSWLDLIDQDLSTTGEPVFAGLRVTGDAVFEGGSILSSAEQIDARANHIYLNADYTTVAAQVGGLVVNYLPTGTSAVTTASGVVTAGVFGVSDPTITVDASVFALADIVSISGSEENDGLYEVFSDVAGLLTLRSTLSGVNNRVEGWSLDQLTPHAGDTGMTITKVNVGVLRCGVDGLWESGSGSSTPIAYSDIVTGAAAAIGSNTSHRTGDGSDHANVAANTAAVAAIQGNRGAWTSPHSPPAPADLIPYCFTPPFDGAEVVGITVAARGAAPTAGTVRFNRGLDGLGATLLSAASYTLSGLSANTVSEMALTLTTSNLQGDKTTGFTMTVENNDGTIIGSVLWGAQ